MTSKALVRPALPKRSIEATPAPITLASCPEAVIYCGHGSSDGPTAQRSWLFQAHTPALWSPAASWSRRSPDTFGPQPSYFAL